MVKSTKKVRGARTRLGTCASPQQAATNTRPAPANTSTVLGRSVVGATPSHLAAPPASRLGWIRIDHLRPDSVREEGTMRFKGPAIRSSMIAGILVVGIAVGA